MGLNHIYKVIWSKTKNAWVVVSEIAKRDGKSSVKSVVTSLAGKSVAAVMVAMVMCGGVASAATGTQYGTGATATYNDSVAVGENAQATNSEVTLVGANSKIQGQYSSVVGFNNKDYGVYGTSPTTNQILGSTNNVKGQHNTIVGSGITISSEGNESTISSDSMGSYNVALGDFQRIGGDRNVSILSDGYILRGKQNVSIGYGSKVIGASTDPNFSTAIGGAMARGDNTVGIGAGAVADNLNKSDTSIAIGTGANASDSIAIGANSGGSLSAQGHSVNIGLRNAQAINKAVILGSNNGYSGGTIVYSDGGVVIGHDNVVRIVKNGIIMGSGNDINGESQIAIGTNIQSTTHLGGVKGAVAIGYNSEFATLNKPSGTLNINGVNLDASNYAGNSSSLTYGNTFSIGKLNNERQLKNVAAGEISATSTDAVNGSQLYEAVRAVTAGASPDVYMHVNDGTSTQGAGGGNNLGKANEKSGALGNYSIAVGKNAQSQGINSISIGYQSGTTNDQSIAIGGNAHVNSSHSIAIGDNADASGTYSTAIGTSSVTGDKNLALNNSYVYSGSDSVAINGSQVAGNNNIAIGGAYIGAGRTYSRDYSGNPTSNIMYIETATPTLGISSMQGEQYLEPVKNSIAIGNNAYVTRSNTIVMGDKTFDNIKSSKTATDFIAPTKSKFSSIISGDINLYHEGTLGNSVYLGHDSYAFTPDALTDGENTSSGENSIHTKKYDAAGNIVVSNNTTGGAFGKVSKATINGDEITGFAGAQSVGAVTIGAGDYERRIQNVAAGEVSATSTDGINGSQLYAVADTLSKNMSSYMHINDGTSTQTVGNATTNYGYSGSKAGATGTKSIAGGVNAQAAGEKSIAIGADATASGEAAIAIGKSVTTDSDSKHSIAMGETSNITGTVGAVVLGQNSSITSSVPGGPSNKTSTSSLVIGRDSHITDSVRSVAIGSNANISQAHDGVAIGSSANITNSENAMAFGEGAKVTNSVNGIAIGGGTEVTASNGLAIGTLSKALGLSSISIGVGNEVKGDSSSAIGDPSYIDTTATGTHVQGNNNGTATNPIKASESTFMGNTNLAGTAGTTGIHVVGNNNSVDSSNVMVVGNNVTVGTGLDGAVVLGHASSADQYAAATDSTINGVTFEAASYAGNTGLNKGSIVSVGATGAERQIKNVAAGAVTATSTDAVNGSQLYKTAETILKMPINMAGDSGDTVGLKLGKTVNIKGSVASGADVTDGNIAVVGDKATSTLSLKMAKNLTGLTSGTFTDATGNQTVINGGGVTVTPTGTGATPISITTSGINAGNQEIKGVKKGTTDDAAVNKKQMDDALAGISSTLTINDGTIDGSVNLKTGKLKVVGESGTNALVTTTVSGDTISVGTSTKLQNAVTAAEKSADKDLSNLSTTGSDKVKTLAQDAVKVAGTGLATVSDATAAGVKTYTVNVDEGKLVIDDTTGKLGATGATQGTVQGKNGVATTQDVASVVNSAIDKTKQALDDAKHNFAGDDATVISRKHGEQLNIKGGASTTATDLTSGNIAVVGDTTSGTLNIKMAKALTGLTSATYTDAAGNTQTVTGGSSTISDTAGNSTVVSKGGVTTTDAAGNTTTTAPTGVTVTPAGTGTTPVSVTTSGISAGNKEIKNVANGTTDDAAVNKKQMDDALKGATDNTVSLGSESGTTTAKKLSTTGGIKFNIKGETGANALITTSASGDDVTIAPTAKLTAAVTAAEKSADKDLSNLSAAGDTYIKNLAKTAASWNVETNGTGTTAVAGGDTVNFINGDNIAITNTGRAITIGTAKNVSFDKVTVGGIVLDKTDGINAGNKEIKGIATGTTADAAVNKAQMDAAITAAAGGSLSTEKVVAKTLSGDNNLATVTGKTGTARGETYEVAVSENAVKAVAQTAAQDAVKVTGTGLASVSDATAAGVKTYTVNVDEGKLVIDDTTGKLGATGASQGATQGKNGVATTQDVASVVNSAIDKTKQALDDAEHKFDGDTGTTSVRKHGEVLSIKGGVTTSAALTTGNIGVVSDGAGTLNIRLAKALTGLTSATYTDAAGNTQTVTGGSSTITDGAGNTTTITKGGVTTTDGTNTTTVAPSGITATDGTHTVTLGGSGINAGGTEIKNIGKATTDDAAVNKKQMDDAVKAATDSVSTLGDNKVSLGSDSGTTTAKKLSTTGGITFNIKGDTGTNALITTSASGDDVTIAPTAKLTAAVTAAEKSADKDLSNLSAAGDSYIKNLAKSAASWNVETNGAGTTAVAGGDTVNFINGDNIAITNTGRSITIGTAKNVSFDKVTVGGIVLDKNTGIDAGGKEITNVGPATSGNSAVNKTQMDTAIANAQTAATSTEKVVAKTLTGDTNLATVTGQTGTAKGETYEVAVSENAVKAVAQTAAQDAVKVTGTGLATVTDSTTGGVKTYNVNVDEGKLVIDDTTGKLGATGASQGATQGKNGVATTQDVASVVNSAIDKTKQALDDAEHKFDGDTGTTSVRKHGEVLSIKGGVTTPADLTTGNIGVVSDGAGTLNIRLAKVLSGLTSASFTTAGGDTTMINGGGVTITPSATGATPISITTAGINAGNKEIKGIANGTTADAAVNKGQLDAAVLAAAGGALSIEKVEAGSVANGKLATGDTNLATVSGLTGATQNETYAVTVSENAVKAVAQTAAQDAVKVAGTGLATVSDATAAGVKTYTVNVDEGKLVIDDTTGKLGATGATQGTTAGKNGVATTQDVATVVNSAIDKTKQALDDAKHNFAGDDATVISRKHGEQLNIKGGASTTATDLTSGNIAVVGDTTSGTLNIKLAKVLTGLTSATYTDAAGNTQTVTGGSSTITDGAGNTTTITKGGVTTTDGTNTTTVAPSGVTATDGTHTVTLGGSGINAGGTEIKNIGKATTDDAAVNKKQMDDAVKAATDSVSTLGDNKVSLGSDAGTTNAKKLSTTGGIKFNIKGDTGTNALITTSATGDDVTIAPTAKLSAAVTAAENAANKDLSNLNAAGDTYIKNLAKSAASWNIETNGTGTTAVAGGDTVNFINGDNIAITNTGRSITIGTAKNVAFDKVTVGGTSGIVIDGTAKQIGGLAAATANDQAVNKGQMDTAIANAQTAATSTEKVEAGSTANGKLAAGDNNLASVSGLTGTAKNETYTVTVSENAVKAVAQTAAQDAVKVAGTGLATVSDATAAGVKTYTVNVDEGKLVIDDTTGKLGATGASQGATQGKNGVATTQDVASVVNSAIDKTKQALDDAEHKFDGDTGTTSVRKHGEVLSIKGGVTTPANLTTGNIGVVSDGAGTLNVRLAKALTGLTSATYTDAAGNTQTVTGGSSTITDGAGNTTTITKGGVTTTDGTNTTTVAPSGITATDGTHTVTLGGSGINAGGTEIKNIGKATTDDAAVNKKQMDDAVKAATDSVSTLGDNKVSLGSDAGTTTAKKLSTTGGIKFNIKGDTGTNALITTSATGDDVTIAPTAKLTAAVTAAENAANKDLSNLNAAGDTYIKNLAKSAASWNVETNGTGTTAVAGGDTVNFINGDNIAITNTGRAITIGTAKNVSFDKVTVGGIVLDKNTGIDAGGKEITNVGPATSGNSAVNKTQMDTAIANAQTAATSTEKVVAKTLTGDTNLATVTGRTGTAKGETYEVAVSENAVKAVAQTAAQDAVKVTGTGLATVTDSTTGGVKTYNVDVKTGNLVVNAAGQAGATGTTGAGGASGADGVATTQNVASAINDAITKSNANTAQALADAEHKFDGDTGATSVRKHGEVLSIKGGVTTPADLTTGNIGVVSDGAGTLNIRLAKVLSGLTSASFTTAGGDTTMINGGGVTITPSATGATPISITTAGINAGNKEIKGIANGTTADAAVNKGQLDAAVLAAAGGSLSTEKVVAKTLTGDTNLVTVTGQTGTAKGETYEVAVSENAVKAVAQTAAQDAVKVTGTGLATVTDSTTGGVKTYNVDVTTGNLVVTATGQVGAAGTTGASGTSGTNGVATTQNVASAINAAITKSNANTAQALADAEHKFDGDTGTTSVRKHGEVLSIKGGVTTPADLTTGNIGVVSDGAGTLNVRLAKTLTGLTSASFTDGTHTVTIGGSGINAGGTEIKNIGKATTDDAAVNKKQMDDAVKAATDSVSTLGDNKVSLGSDAGTTTAKKLSTTGGIKFNIKGDTGTNALITTSATGDDVTIAPTAKLSAAVTAAENAANKDLSNLSAAGDTYIKNLAKTAASWNVETNGTGTTAVAGGDTVNFINGDNIAITNTGRAITIGTAKNVSFDKVTVGGIVLDKNTGIDAGGKEITNVGPATSGNSAVNKTQMDTAITNAVNKATTDAKHDFGGDDTTVVTRKHGEKLNIKGGASTTAADLTAGNIAVLGDAATGTLNIRMAKALTGLSSATFTTPSGTTVINSGGMTITPSAAGAAPISITTGGINAGNTEIKNVAAGTTPNSAVNKQQMDSAISNATANVGFHTAGNTGTGSVSNGQTLTITGTNGIETNASGQSITVGLDAATRAQINNATTTANNAAKKDLSNIDNAGKQMIKDTAAWNVKVNSVAAETVKGGDTVTFNDGDNIKVTNTGKDITIATKKDVSFDKVTVGNVVIDKNTHRISGLANAVNNDEAVNLGQMNAAISTVTAGTNTIKYKANSGTQNSVALTTGFDFKGDSNIQITADPANSGVINYKLNPALTGITSISGGTGAPTITLNAGSGSNPGNVSINSNLDMGGKQINNIGAATHAGDAVNKAQMDQALQNIAGASSNVAKSYAYKAGAGAAALAALKPIQYDPLEPTQIMAGIGNYKSQTAVALGVAHYTNENTMFNFGVSLDSHDGIVNAGVTHKFGYSPEKKAIPDRYKGGPISSIYVMQDEVTALQAIVQKQAAENEALRQQNEDMQRKVDMILSKIH